jgi:hypothetical protein
MSRKPWMLALVLGAGLLGAGCGGEEASVVEKALDNPVKSARVSLSLDVEQRGRRVARLALSGPVRSNGEGRLESFDWRLRIAAAGERTVAARVMSTGENVFVRYRGTTYEVGERAVAKLNRQAGKGEDVDGLRDLSRLGIDLREWFPETAGEPADGEVAGVATEKVAGRLDVSVALKQLAPLLRRPELRAQLGGDVGRLRPRDIEAIDALISDPRFELEAGRDDGKLRRLAARFRFRDPRSGGGGGAVRFELRLAGVDEPVRIDAPSSGRPIGRLLERLGLAGGVGQQVPQPA